MRIVSLYCLRTENENSLLETGERMYECIVYTRFILPFLRPELATVSDKRPLAAVGELCMGTSMSQRCSL